MSPAGRRRGGGVLFGLALFIGTFGVLIWNEGRAVTAWRGIAQIEGELTTLDSPNPDPALNGQPIFVSAATSTNAPVADSQFGLSVNDAALLERDVEMFQWRETRRSSDGNTRYDYAEVWSSTVINSNSFNNSSYRGRNPSQMLINGTPVSSQTFSTQVSLGSFSLPTPLVNQIERRRSVTPNANQMPGFAWGGQTSGEWIHFGRGTPGSPQIGDVRVRFRVADNGPVSVLAVQQGSGFAPYQSDGDYQIFELEDGSMTAGEMIGVLEDRNSLMTWGIRVGGTLLMAFGLRVAFSPLTRLIGMIPLLGGIVNRGIGLVTFVIALFLSLLTIGITWLAYRPALTIILIAVGAAALLLPRFLGKKDSRVQVAATAGYAGPGAPPPPMPPSGSAAPPPPPPMPDR